MFLVTGITGKIGGATARRLLEQGQSVRALVRDTAKAADWEAQGVELRQGDLTNAADVAAALRGVEGAFLMQPTPIGVSTEFALARALNASVVVALQKAPPPRLVVLSSIGSEQKSGLGNITQTHLLEEALSDLPFPTAWVRSAALIENQLGALPRAQATGILDSFLQPTDRAVPVIATKDVGAEIARLLIEGWSGKRIVEIGSPIAPDEIAAAFSQVLGKPIQAQPIPREQWAQMLGYIGLKIDEISNWEEMQDGYNSGWIHFGVPGTETVAGTTTPAEVFAQIKDT